MSAGNRKRHERMEYKRTAGYQCLGKLRFHTQTAADRAINDMRGYARAYRCPICHHLHLTSKPLRTQ